MPAGALERLVGGEVRFEGEDRVDRVVRQQHAHLGRVGVELQRLVVGGDEPKDADRLDAGAVERGDGGLGEEVFKRLLFRGSGEAVGAQLEELPSLRGLAARADIGAASPTAVAAEAAKNFLVAAWFIISTTGLEKGP